MPRSSKYVEAAREVLTELGGGPVPSRTLIDAIVEKGLLEPRKYLYHNVLRKVRESDEFDTSQRGFVALAGGGTKTPAAEMSDEPAAATEVPVAGVPSPSPQIPVDDGEAALDEETQGFPRAATLDSFNRE